VHEANLILVLCVFLIRYRTSAPITGCGDDNFGVCVCVYGAGSGPSAAREIETARTAMARTGGQAGCSDRPRASSNGQESVQQRTSRKFVIAAAR
jgi:hypothetical protein